MTLAAAPSSASMRLHAAAQSRPSVKARTAVALLQNTPLFRLCSLDFVGVTLSRLRRVELDGEAAHG